MEDDPVLADIVTEYLSEFYETDHAFDHQRYQDGPTPVNRWRKTRQEGEEKAIAGVITRNDLDAKAGLMHVFGPSPTDIRRTALFRAPNRGGP